ncbi:MAG TPA: hypothetical protein VN822_05910 [Candidatus Acidoferrales bacterium]|nr:hypothetical protein [Candidatus Acidoferrales bacterium]
MDKKLFWREFWIMWGLGVAAGAAEAYIAKLPVTPLAHYLFLKSHELHGSSLAGLEGAEIVLELAITVGVGLLAAHAVGLGAPILEAALRGERDYPNLSSLLVPTLLVGLIVGAFSVTPDLPVFHPNRQAAHRDAEKILNSPAGAQLSEKLNRFAGPPLTAGSSALLDVTGAISGALDRLLWISGIAWLLMRIRRDAPGPASRGVLWATILIVAAIGAVFYFTSHAAGNAAMLSAIGNLLIPSDPRWIVAARGLLAVLPGSIGLGWLYTRRGLESTIVASLVARTVQHVLVVLVVARFH